METVTSWADANTTLLVWVGVGSLVLLVVGLLVLPVIVVRIPSDFFVRPHPPPRHPLLRIVRNLVGLVVILAGVAMLVLPGQGILTILAGLALVDFPGKRRLELAIVRRPIVRRAVEAMRFRRGAPPLDLGE